MRKLIIPLVAALALAAAGTTSAMAASADYPVLTESTMYCDGIDDPLTCIDGPDESDLPQEIDVPEIEDPWGAPEPNPGEAQCSAFVIRDFATSLADLRDFCPTKPAFNDAKLALMRGPAVHLAPRCNRLNDQLILHYLVASGGTSNAPVSGDCKRGEQVSFSMTF